MKRFLYGIMALVLVIAMAEVGWGQTTVFTDDFSSGQSATWTTSGTIGSSSWSVNRSGDDWGARRNTSPAQLELTNDVGGTANVLGWVFANVSTSGFSSPYNTTLSSNSGPVTWYFNMRQIRTDPAGYASGSYAAAFILGTTSQTANNSGTGYAIVYGQTGSTDPIRLARFSGGLLTGLTNIITSNTSGLTDFGAEYLSIKVIYNPSNNQWELFLRNDGASAFADPATGTLTSQGTATDNTYTGTSLAYMGGYWQGSTAGSQTTFFDNVSVKVTTEPTTPASEVNFTSVGSEGMTINWTSGNGTNRLVLVKSGSAVDGTPVDGTSYTANTVFSSGTQIGTGNYVVYNGTGSSVAITGLSASTTYHVAVFEFNGSGGTENYLTSSPATGSQETSAAVSPVITVSTATLTGFTYAEGFGPSSSQNYNLSGSNLDPASGNLTVTGSTNYEVSTNNSTFGSSVNVAYTGGTLAETPIYIRLKAGLSIGSYNSETVANSGGGATTKNVTCSGTVTTPEPSNHPTSFNATLGTPSYGKITLTWTDASSGTLPDGYLIKASTVSYDDITASSDGATESDVLLKRNIVQGTQTASFGDLSANTTYYFKIYPYKGSGASINYKTDESVQQVSKATDALPSNLLLERNFDYTGKLTDYGWTAHSSGGTNPISTTTGLTYSGYPCSGIGNAAAVGNSGEDINLTFTQQTSGSVFVTFLVKVTSANTISDYFLNLGPSTISTTYRGRVFVQKDESDNLAFGLSFGSGSASVTTSFSYSLNTTYLIALKYEIVSSTYNDVVKLAINPSLGGSEPTYDLTHSDVIIADPDNIGSIALRQGSQTYTVIVDGIRVGLTYTDTSLPVELTSFTAKPSGNSVALAWSTESEIENMGFILERRQEAGEWTQVASYTTDETLQGHGSTTEAHEYSYTDAAVQPGATYTYLLSDVSYDGVVKKHTDKAVTVTIPEGGAAITDKFALSSPYPNPFNAQFTIPLTLKESLPVQIYLYDMNGKVVRSILNSQVSAGEYRLKTDTGNLSSGIYIVKMNIGGAMRTEKIVLVK